MTGDAARFWGLILFLAACLLGGQANLCHSRDATAPALVLAAGPGKYVIKAGDTLGLLSLRYGVPTAAILKANPGLNPARLPLGKEIIIPSGTKTAGEAVPAVQSAPVTAPAGSGGLELRPEKAPQATPPLHGHDLPDSPQKIAPLSPPSTGPRDLPQAGGAKPSAPSAPSLAGAVAGSRDMPAASNAAPAPTPTGPEAASGPAAKGWPVWGVVAVAASGLALVFVFQGALGNLAAGMTLRLLRPFRTGDAVSLAGIVGRVESMGAWYVAIRSETGEAVYVPNAKAAGEIVVVAKAGKAATPKETPRRVQRG
ncbi:mechanosensitive ion channel domain-containing protein [Solidesulfovibrio carbinolicus]|uniref:Small-conductance mechanosensitive channel n=1 Tax=Solidesulfovibrio carbinolicus TaxID=296842 RepID=A0A4V0YQZ2_9BACT|nr:mechanosensitive ion channel domain-containing protein [Solidesulfovibrio carbinolicus]QAZ67992.1 small-conductance mechanosensitive channel [Solidesulfovibrio carbinolicus]